MLRKLGIIFLLIFYSFSQTGIRLEINSCFGRVRSIGLGNEKKCLCLKHSEIKSKSCCATQSIHFSAKESLTKNIFSSIKSPVVYSDKMAWISLFAFSDISTQNLLSFCKYQDSDWGPPPYLRFHCLRV